MRCKPGQDCFVIKSFAPENIGKIVTIIARTTYPGMDWDVRSAGSPLTGMCQMTGDIKQSTRMAFRDSQLIPIGTDDSTMELANELILDRKAKWPLRTD